MYNFVFNSQMQYVMLVAKIKGLSCQVGEGLVICAVKQIFFLA